MAPFIPSLVFVTTLVTAAIHAAAHPDNVLHELIARQTIAPPSPCDDQCSALATAANSPSCSTDAKCLCGPDILSKVQSCVQCDATVIGTAAAESVYKDYVDACKDAGVTVPSFTPSVPSSTSGGNKASTTGAITPSPTSASSDSTSASPTGSSGGNTGTTSTNKGAGAYSNLQISVAGAVGSAALVFMITS